jgi:alpha-glucosidase
MWLRKVDGQKLRAMLAPSSYGPAVVRHGAFSTPWRTLQIADDAAGLYMSDLVLNLNEPNKLGDVSWVKPVEVRRRVVGDAPAKGTWNAGPEACRQHGQHQALYRLRGEERFPRRAGRRLEPGLGKRLGPRRRRLQLHQPYPDFDLPGLAAYAKTRGVRLIGHHETGGNLPAYEKQMERRLQAVCEARRRQRQVGLCARRRQHAVHGPRRQAALRPL